MLIDQVSVFVENQEGRLAAVTELLADAGVDILALSIADTTDFGILRIVVDDTEKAVKVLRDNDRIVKVTEVLGVKMDNQPGVFAKVVRLLADNGIGIEYTYAYAAGRGADSAALVLRVGDNEKATEILKNAGFAV